MEAKVKIQKLNENAVVPTYGSAFAAGADLYALTEGNVVIEPHQTVFLHTGIAIELPMGYAGLVFARSGLSCKSDLAPANKVGVIDCDYRGEIMVAMHNHGTQTRTVKNGDRIAQLVITPYLTAVFEECEALSDTVRGADGFGSTDKKQ